MPPQKLSIPCHGMMGVESLAASSEAQRSGVADAVRRLPQGSTKNRENNPMQSRMPGPGRELINLLDGQLARVRYALIADVLLRGSETTRWA